MNLKEQAKNLKTDIPAVILALKAKDTPFAAKALAAVTVAYALSPIDLIPDFIPILGLLDDLLILPGLVAVTVKLIPPHILARSREEVKINAEKKTKKWYYAIPVLLVWLLIIFLILKVIIK